MRADGRRLPHDVIVVVDGSNVIGTRPDGWWRDRPAAARRLLVRLQCLQARTHDDLLLVLDHVVADIPEGDHAGVAVRYATRRGRDAADDRIREIVAELHDQPVEVVTSDRALTGDVRSAAAVVPAGAFLARLDDAGC